MNNIIHRDFSGDWITEKEICNISAVNVFHRQNETYNNEGILEKNLHILFRKNFVTNDEGRTVIYITADDYYKLYINGKFVTQGPAPGFPFHYYYNEIDITEYVRSGINSMAVHTYYQGYINRVWVSGDDRHGLIFDIEQNGKIVAKSDETVKCCRHSGFEALGITGYETQVLERYNSNSDEVGFELSDFDDSKWNYAAIRKNTDYTLCKQPTKQLDISKIAPCSVEKKDNRYKIDFGSIYIGYLSLRAIGNKNDKIIIRCGQELDDAGEVRYELRANCVYEEEWILSGNEDKLNQFDYKSFRYAELIVPKGCEIDNIEMIIRHYPFELKRQCKYNDPEILKIWDLCVNSLKYGVQEVIQDCMDREKGQYLGDGSFTSTSLAVLTGDISIMEKLIDDALATSFITRGLITCSPCSFMQEIGEYPLMLPELFLAHWHLTGDKKFLDERYDKLKDMLDYYSESYGDENGLLRDLDKWCVVDWPQNARDGYDFNLVDGQIAYGIHNAINGYYLGAVKTLNKLAKILGRKEYKNFSKLKNAYINTFYDSNKKLFTDTDISSHTSLAANVFALMFDLCPDKETEGNIVNMIMEKDPECSAFFVSFASLGSLVRLGREDLLKKYITNKGRWLRMIDEGATVTFEAWGKDVKWNTSLFHLCYTYVILFLADWGIEKLFA